LISSARLTKITRSFCSFGLAAVAPGATIPATIIAAKSGKIRLAYLLIVRHPLDGGS
jgi:hypothetical protein